ncbi:hypothetical protein BDR03DRAFT_1016201 [Suillus americanus]|nr:hypothetical protein BDR03DRAFT_1016201 [Suillus americanus]
MFSHSAIFTRSSPKTNYYPPSTPRASSSPSSRPDKGHPCPTHSPQSHPVKEEDDDDESYTNAFCSAKSSYLFDQPAEEVEDSDLTLEAAQAKRKVCQAQKHLADRLLEHHQILIHISHHRAEAANQCLLLADLNIGCMHSERQRKNGITMFTIQV